MRWGTSKHCNLLVCQWKLGQGHQNLITSFPRPNNVFFPVWSKSMHWFTTKIDCKAHFYSINSVVTLKFGHGHLNFIISFPRPNNVSLAVWSKSMHWFTRYTADKVHFYSLNSVVTLKIESRSPYSDQTVYLSQWYITWSLVWIHHLVHEIGCRQAFVESKFNIQSAYVTLKMRPRSPKSLLILVPMVFLSKFGQNQGSGNIENWIGPADDVIT